MWDVAVDCSLFSGPWFMPLAKIRSFIHSFIHRPQVWATRDDLMNYHHHHHRGTFSVTVEIRYRITPTLRSSAFTMKIHEQWQKLTADWIIYSPNETVIHWTVLASTGANHHCLWLHYVRAFLEMTINHLCTTKNVKDGFEVHLALAIYNCFHNFFNKIVYAKNLLLFLLF